MEKFKVVWICSFANEEVANQIGKKTDMFAPWMSEFIEMFKNKTDIKLTIIAPNCINNKNINFSKDGIDFFFYKERVVGLLKKSRDLTYSYLFATRNVINIVRKINPDVIHLFGSENPIYAASAIKLMKTYPILVSIQGFVHQSPSKRNLIANFIRYNRIRIELIINKTASYFASGTEEINKYLKTINPKAKIYWSMNPTTNSIFSAQNSIKQYDIVYYAKITKEKGVEDLLDAILILKKTRPLISALIIGGGNASYIDYIRSRITSSNLDENIFFAGFQASQQDVFKLAAQARIYVLPTHFDGLPGSLREAMFMKLPVVAYAVGAIPQLNRDKECITLVEKQNINDLVAKIELVLEDKERTNRLVRNAYEVITDKYDNSTIYDNLLSIYADIIR